MKRPTLEEIREYAKQLDYDGFDAVAFKSHYDANGWRVGKVPMVSWKAAVVNWRQTEKRWAQRRKPQMPYRKREDKINELNRRKQQLIRTGAPYWKIHEIDMQLREL